MLLNIRQQKYFEVSGGISKFRVEKQLNMEHLSKHIIGNEIC